MSGKNPNRQLQGKISKAEGKEFEERLEKSFEFYRSRGVAAIEKTPEPMRVVRNLGKGKFLAYFEKSAQPDYQGTVKGGRAVMIEAKHTDKDRMAQSRVKDGQAEYLRCHEALGARCYVIAGFDGCGVYRIPYRVWADMKRIYGRKYVTPADIENYQIREAGGILLVLHRTKGEQKL